MKVAVGLSLVALLFVGAVDLIQGDLRQAATFPYTWLCEDKKCVRHLKSEAENGGVPMDVCKLNCDDVGSLWPQPTGELSVGKDLVSLYNTKITVDDDKREVPDAIKSMADEAFAIFKRYLRNVDSEDDAEVNKHDLKVILKATDGAVVNTLSTDESYTLQITTTVVSGNTNVVANITAVTFFGLRHGLETLSQLIAYDGDNDVLQIVSNVTVVDKPVFPYRSIMLDTSRNYYSIEHLKRLIDGMSYNKLNIFHWHITDSHSFPMEVTRRPKMIQYGAYSPEKIYTAAAIKDLVAYARQRGVKIIPELDQPAHSGYGYQWGKEDGLGDLVVCVDKQPWYDFCVEPPCGQLNLVNDNVTEVVGDIFKDIFDMFDNDIFHMGGDEVDFRCYNSTPEVTDWMMENNYTLDSDGFFRLWGEFQQKLLGKVYEASKMNDSTQAILWTSGLTHPDRMEDYLDKDKYIIQFWSESTDETIGGILQKGYKAYFANVDALYLDCGFPAWLGSGHNWCAPVKGWQVVYDNDPEKIYAQWVNASDAERAVREGQILGAETPLWSEQSDDAALESRIWPRAAAHAERLWTHPSTDHSVAWYRMLTNRQRMVDRGIKADRLQPEHCLQHEGRCYAETPSKKNSANAVSSSTFLAVFVFAVAKAFAGLF